MQGSLWLALGGGRLHASAASFGTGDYSTPVDEVLARPGAMDDEQAAHTVDRLLEQEELMQEAKFGNMQLVEFLSTPAAIERLVRHTIAQPPPDPALKPAQPAQPASANAASAAAEETPASSDADASAAAKDSTAAIASDADGVADLREVEPSLHSSHHALPPGSLMSASIDENSSAILPVGAAASVASVASPTSEEEAEAETRAAVSADAASDEGESSDNAEVDPAEVAARDRDVMDDDYEHPEPQAAREHEHDQYDHDSSLSSNEDGAPPLSDEEDVVLRQQHKYPYIASELLCGDIGNVVDVLVDDERLLGLLFSLLDRPPPLDPSQVSYFRKTVQVLIQHRYPALVSFCARSGVLDSLVRHLGLYSLLELLIMLGWDSGLDNATDQRWMLHQRAIPKLVRRMHPAYQHLPDVHAHAGRLLVDVVVKCPLGQGQGQHGASPLVEHLSTTPILQALFSHMFSGCSSSLSNSLSVIIVLVQRFANTRLEQLEQHAHQVAMLAAEQGVAPPSFDPESVTFVVAPPTNEWNSPDDYSVAVGARPDPSDETDIFPVEARSLIGQGKGTDGQTMSEEDMQQYPLGSDDPEVIKLGEPFISLMPHLPRILDLLQPDPAAASSSSSSAAASGSLSPSAPMPIQGVLGGSAFGSLRMKVVELCLVLARSRSALIDRELARLGVAGTMLRVFFAYPWNNLLHGLVESIVTSALEEPDSALTRALFAEGALVDSFERAWASNEDAQAKGQMRRGYMGHLIRTAATVDHMLASMTHEVRHSLLGEHADRWATFVARSLSPALAAQQTEEVGVDALLANGFGELSMLSGSGGQGLPNSVSQSDLQSAADAAGLSEEDAADEARFVAENPHLDPEEAKILFRENQQSHIYYPWTGRAGEDEERSHEHEHEQHEHDSHDRAPELYEFDADEPQNGRTNPYERGASHEWNHEDVDAAMEHEHGIQQAPHDVHAQAEAAAAITAAASAADFDADAEVAQAIAAEQSPEPPATNEQ